MSSAGRKLVYVDGEPHWLTDEERVALGVNRPQADGAFGGRDLLPMSHNAREGYSIGASLSHPTPERIAAENELCRRHGISGVRFDPNHKHNCRITDNAGFAKYLKVTGRENADGGFNGY